MEPTNLFFGVSPMELYIMNRRSFIKLAGSVAAAAAVGVSLPQEEKVAEVKQRVSWEVPPAMSDVFGETIRRASILHEWSLT